jgi:hypothetical protein
MKKQTRILLIISLFALVFALTMAVRLTRPVEQVVSMNEPVDIVLDFYEQWLSESQSEEVDPFKSGLAKSEILNIDLQKKLKNINKDSENDLDPVLCQTTSDIEIATRRVSEQEERVQILVTSRDKALTGQAVVTLLAKDGGWYINDITCFPGEFEEEREFTFEREGYAVMGSMLESVNPEQLHLIFEENNEPGYSVPLLFDEESVCIDTKGTESTCVIDQFTEVTKVFVKGAMTELGVEVKNLEVSKK